MSAKAWRNVAIGLAMLCAFLWWRGGRVRRPAAAPPAAPVAAIPSSHAERDDDGDDDRPPTAEEAEADSEEAAAAAGGGDGDTGGTAFGFQLPEWARWFMPQPGEDLLAYRDRLYPFARAVIEPHRERIARGLADFDAVAHLDARQHAELDAAVDEAAGVIEDKVMQGIMSGDLMPEHFKPSTGVTYAREILDAVDNANQRFVASLTDEQRMALAQHPFDFADYLLFHTHWEELIGITTN